MTDSMADKNPIDRFRQEMAAINYLDLQKFFASGVILVVHKDVDMIDTALKIHQDDAESVEKMIQDELLNRANDKHAKKWFKEKSTLMAVTVAPWVLVQEK